MPASLRSPGARGASGGATRVTGPPGVGRWLCGGFLWPGWVFVPGGVGCGRPGRGGGARAGEGSGAECPAGGTRQVEVGSAPPGWAVVGARRCDGNLLRAGSRSGGSARVRRTAVSVHGVTAESSRGPGQTTPERQCHTGRRATESVHGVTAGFSCGWTAQAGLRRRGGVRCGGGHHRSLPGRPRGAASHPGRHTPTPGRGNPPHTPARPPEASARPTPSPGPRPPRRPAVPGGVPRRPSRGGRVPLWPFVRRGRSPGRFRRGPGGACGT